MFSKTKKISLIINSLLILAIVLFYFEKSSYAQTQKYIVTLSAPKTLVGDGVTSATITAKITDLKRNPVPGVEVMFSTISGEGVFSPESATTDGDGNASTSLTSAKPGKIYVTVKIEGANLRGKKVRIIRVKKASQNLSLNLTLTAEPGSIQADGESTSTITALLRNSANNAVKGATLTFEADHGTITASAVTDSSGIAKATLISDDFVGDVTVTARYSSISKTISVEFTEVTESVNLTIKANPKSIQADGESTSTITALLRNSKNNPVIGATITFEADHGVITASGVTNSSGIATATLISDDFNGDVTVTARYSSLSKTTLVKFVATGLLKLALSLSTNTIPSDGTTTAIITATLTDSANNPISGKTVTFSNALDNDGDGTISEGDELDYGTLSATSGITDSDGKVTGITISSSKEGSIVVKAEVDGTVAYAGLKAVAPATVKSVTITAADSKILVNGGSTLITATFQNVTSGTATFTTTLGYFTSSSIIPTTVSIDSSGVAKAMLTAGTLTGKAEIKVFTIVDNETVEGTTSVTIYSTTPATIEVTSSSYNIKVNTGTSVITAKARDAFDNPVADQEIQFYIENSTGGGETLDPGTKITDENGVASVNFKAGGLTTSSINRVKIKAFLVNTPSISSSTFLTISGKPHYLSISVADLPEKAGPNFKLSVSALVSDIHGNPVADGTSVNFGVAITRLVDLKFKPSGAPYGFLINTEDTNKNGQHDNIDEDTNGNLTLDAGEDTAFNGGPNGKIDIDKDVNENGIVDFIEDVNANGQLDGGEDLNGNGKLDRTLSTTNVVITRDSTTSGAIAEAKLTYGVNLKARYQVLISAEADGVVTDQYIVLPDEGHEEQVGSTENTITVPLKQSDFKVLDTKAP